MSKNSLFVFLLFAIHFNFSFAINNQNHKNPLLNQIFEGFDNPLPVDPFLSSIKEEELVKELFCHSANDSYSGKLIPPSEVGSIQDWKYTEPYAGSMPSSWSDQYSKSPEEQASFLSEKTRESVAYRYNAQKNKIKDSGLTAEEWQHLGLQRKLLSMPENLNWTVSKISDGKDSRISSDVLIKLPYDNFPEVRLSTFQQKYPTGYLIPTTIVSIKTKNGSFERICPTGGPIGFPNKPEEAISWDFRNRSFYGTQFKPNPTHKQMPATLKKTFFLGESPFVDDIPTGKLAKAKRNSEKESKKLLEEQSKTLDELSKNEIATKLESIDKQLNQLSGQIIEDALDTDGPPANSSFTEKEAQEIAIELSKEPYLAKLEAVDIRENGVNTGKVAIQMVGEDIVVSRGSDGQIHFYKYIGGMQTPWVGVNPFNKKDNIFNDLKDPRVLNKQ